MTAAFLLPNPLPARQFSTRLAITPRRPPLRHRLSMQTPFSDSNSTPDNSIPFDASAEQPTDTPIDSVINATARDVPLSDIKQDLYAALLPLNRGLAASPSAKTDVLALIEQLERLNPTPEPNESTLLTGEWKLLYTNALDVLSLGLLAPIALVSEVFQNVFEAPEDKGYDYDIKNIVQLEPSFAPVSNAFFGRTWTSVTVSATGIKKSSSRVDITFVDSVIKPESVAGFDVPDVLPPFRIRLGSPVGYIETTFLDEDIRVARAPPGSIQGENLFVLLRVQ